MFLVIVEPVHPCFGRLHGCCNWHTRSAIDPLSGSIAGNGSGSNPDTPGRAFGSRVPSLNLESASGSILVSSGLYCRQWIPEVDLHNYVVPATVTWSISPGPKLNTTGTRKEAPVQHDVYSHSHPPVNALHPRQNSEADVAQRPRFTTPIGISSERKIQKELSIPWFCGYGGRIAWT